MSGVGAAGEAADAEANRVAAAAGFASAAVGLAGVAVAVAIAPWFSWTGNALSDLGLPSHESAVVFNVALIASGALNLEFVLVLRRKFPRTLEGRVAAVMLAAGAISLAAVGAVNESFGVAHLIVSITYFTFVAIGILVAGIAMLPHARRLAWGSIAAGAVSGVFGVTVGTALVYGTPFPSQAIPELIASLIFASWTVRVGWMLWTGTFPKVAVAS